MNAGARSAQPVVSVERSRNAQRRDALDPLVPEQLQAMKDGLARLAAQGVEAIED